MKQKLKLEIKCKTETKTETGQYFKTEITLIVLCRYACLLITSIGPSITSFSRLARSDVPNVAQFVIHNSTKLSSVLVNTAEHFLICYVIHMQNFHSSSISGTLNAWMFSSLNFLYMSRFQYQM